MPKKMREFLLNILSPKEAQELWDWMEGNPDSYYEITEVLEERSDITL